MKPKINISIYTFDCSVVIVINDMDERFRAVEGGVGTFFKCKNSIEIRSYKLPSTVFRSTREIYLRGYEKYKDYVPLVCETFPSNTSRDEFISELKEALKEWSNNWSGFKHVTEECPVVTPPLVGEIFCV